MITARNRVLFVDGLINLFLGGALLCFEVAADWFGVPLSDTAFYLSLLKTPSTAQSLTFPHSGSS
jgi:hypothetical protein